MSTTVHGATRTSLPGLVVRAARPDEYEQIAQVLLAAYTATFAITDWYRQNLLKVAEHAVNHEWWVAVDDGRVLGALRTPRPGVQRDDRFSLPDEITFGTLGVHPAARGQGVARALIAHVVALGHRRGSATLAIWTGPQMTDAHRLYEGLGFVRCPERETLVVDGGQRLRSYVLPLVDGAVFRPPVASAVDFERYGTIYAPRNVPPASTALDTGAYPFRDRVGVDVPAQSGRYHLYVSWACPFAQRVAIVRELAGLADVVPLWVIDPLRDGRGWAFRDGPGLTRDGGGGGFALLREAYDATVGRSYDGRVSVPVLWDSEQQRIVSNFWPTIVRDLGTAFDEWAAHPVDLAPADLRAESDALVAQVERGLVTGVYRAGFATDQATYDAAVADVFGTLDELEARLSDGRDHLLGERLTEADLALWPTLARFDLVYHGHFGVNLRRLAEYPFLSAYAARLAAVPAFARTTNVDHIRRHYFVTQRHVNPHGIVPAGPVVPWLS